MTAQWNGEGAAAEGHKKDSGEGNEKNGEVEDDPWARQFGEHFDGFKECLLESLPDDFGIPVEHPDGRTETISRRTLQLNLGVPSTVIGDRFCPFSPT